MARSFEELQEDARSRWQTLTAGDRPWIRIGTALCGKAAGADHVKEAIQQELQRHGIQANVSEVGCLGLCYAEPLVDITLPGGPRLFYSNVTPSMVNAIIYSHLVRREPVANLALGYLGEPGFPGVNDLSQHPMMKGQLRVALRNAGNVDPCDIYQYIESGGYSALHKALTQMTPEKVLEEVNTSGLRGRGGAAFPTGTKWSFLARSTDPVKYILCNCEEGDPGAFNDKGILGSDPNTLLEGMLLAGYATGAAYGYVFIRHGHNGPIERTWQAIHQARELGLLGENILGTGFSFDIEVSLTGDSYVSGEETALMESIEGSRAMPRFRPPFPAQVGLFGKPSNINNVKTLSYVPQILANGGEWFAGIGQNRSKGTVILCLSGNLRYTGMVEVPLGMTLQEVIHDVAGGVPGGKGLKLLADWRPPGRGAQRRSTGDSPGLRGHGPGRGDPGLRGHHRRRRRHLRCGPDPGPHRLLPVRVLRQVLPLQAGHDPLAGGPGAHIPLRKRARGPGPDAQRGREHAGGLPVRPRPAGVQPGVVGSAVLCQ